jgi:hypothetical protein
VAIAAGVLGELERLSRPFRETDTATVQVSS